MPIFTRKNDMSEKEKMLSGELYDSSDAELCALRRKAHALCRRYNALDETAMHPLKWQERNQFQKADGTFATREYAKPITIGDNCWIAGDVTICGGVTIGEGSVIGAGSVVTRDIPPNVVAVGNPCRVLKAVK